MRRTDRRNIGETGVMVDESSKHWQQLESETLLVTPYVEVRRDHVIRHDGKQATYDVVRIPQDVVVIVPIRAKREVLMIRQFRQPVRMDSCEIPAGGIDEGETPEQAARRELVEETGWDCPNLRLARTYHPLAGRSNVRFHIMLAPEPTHVGDPTDPDEAEEIFWADQARFAELWNRQRIHAGATVTGLLLAVAMKWLEWDIPAAIAKEGAE